MTYIQKIKYAFCLELINTFVLVSSGILLEREQASRTNVAHTREYTHFYFSKNNSKALFHIKYSSDIFLPYSKVSEQKVAVCILHRAKRISTRIKKSFTLLSGIISDNKYKIKNFSTGIDYEKINTSGIKVCII